MPLLLSLLLFVYFALLGRSVMVALKYEAPVLRGWLAAPTVGLAVVTLAIMALNQAGWPIRDFALPLLAGGLFFSAAVCAWRRPCLPVRALLPFAGVLLHPLLCLAGLVRRVPGGVLKPLLNLRRLLVTEPSRVRLTE